MALLLQGIERQVAGWCGVCVSGCYGLEEGSKQQGVHAAVRESQPTPLFRVCLPVCAFLCLCVCACRRGLNYADEYRPEMLFDLRGCRQKDKGNDQRPATPSSKASAATSRGQASSSGGGVRAAAEEGPSSPPATQQPQQQERSPAGSSSGQQGATSGQQPESAKFNRPGSSSQGDAQQGWVCVLEWVRGGAGTEADLVWLRQQAQADREWLT